MSNKSEQKEIVLEIKVPTSGFPRRMYFNRFRMERERGFCLVQFGLMVASELVDSYAITLPAPVLNEHRKSLLEYYGRLKPSASQERVQWKGSASALISAPVVDIIAMSHRGDMAEICVHGFSMHGATVLSRAEKPEAINAEPLAILRSEVELQKQVIAALYEE